MAEIKIQRGSTEQITAEVEHDLTGYTCILSIGKKNAPVIKVDNSQMTMSVSEGVTTLVYTLSQEQTLRLKEGQTHIQLRAINGDTAVGWNMVEALVLPVIDQAVIVDEY